MQLPSGRNSRLYKALSQGFGLHLEKETLKNPLELQAGEYACMHVHAYLNINIIIVNILNANVRANKRKVFFSVWKT